MPSIASIASALFVGLRMRSAMSSATAQEAVDPADGANGVSAGKPIVGQFRVRVMSKPKCRVPFRMCRGMHHDMRPFEGR